MSWSTPGLVDAHAHLTFEARDRLGLPRGSPELIAAQLHEQRRAGVLYVRDAGSLPGVDVPSGGGRVVACGPFLAPPDFYLPHLYAGVPAEQAVDVARARIRDGAAWVKLIADFPVGAFNPLAPQLGYPLDVVRRICDAVHEEGGRVAAHVMGVAVRELVGLGVDSIEHGNLADEATVEAMAERGVAWTPTLATVAGHLEPIAGRVPPAAALLDLQRRTLPLAAEAGVTVLAGTDEEPHGSVAHEVATLHRYGLPAGAALAAATTAARAFLRMPDLDGDRVTFAGDPAEDLGVLAQPVEVLLAGERVQR